MGADLNLSQDPFFKDFFYYQIGAVESSTKYMKKVKKRNGIVVSPTGSGKTYISSGMIKIFAGDAKARVVLVSHTKKIVQQDYNKAVSLWPDGKKLFGINSAGLGRRDYKDQVLFTGIQSVYKDAKSIGEVNVLIPDECHRINMLDSIQYKQFIEDLYDLNPNMRVAGLTATPFRPNMGLIYGPSSYQLFDDLIYTANVKELIAGGYIAKPVIPPIEDKKSLIDIHGVEVKKTKNDQEYDQKQMGERVNVADKIMRQTKLVLENSEPYETIASFAFNIEHAEAIAQSYIDCGEKSVAVVHSEIEGDDEQLIADFESGKIRVLVSVNMFVEGFDAPNIQVIDDRKPTASAGRYGQMGGRGFRICKSIGKTSFKYFCFSGNVGIHGPLDQIRESKDDVSSTINRLKECPKCGMEIARHFKICPHCQYIYPDNKRETIDKTYETIDKSTLISEPKWMDVTRLHCSESRNSPAIVAHYYCGTKKFTKEARFDSEGIEWLKMHLGDDLPFDLKNFFNGGFRSKMKKPQQIFVDDAGAASKILEYKF
jgi:DNA repair protein RadD